MIIGICGLINAGKDTVAEYLIQDHGFRRDSFAASLKDAVSVVFGWDRELLEGHTQQSRVWREQVNSWWAQRLSIPDLTPRWILQNWGTELFRRNFHEDIWVASIENKLRQRQDAVVISDCRFPNEVEALRSLGGRMVRVIRGPDPHWFSTAKNSPGLMPGLYPQIHASEWSWAATDFDHYIHNNGTLDQLRKSVNDLVRDIQAAKEDRS